MFEAQPEREVGGDWFTVLPQNMHAEQKRFLLRAAPVSLSPGDPDGLPTVARG